MFAASITPCCSYLPLISTSADQEPLLSLWLTAGVAPAACSFLAPPTPRSLAGERLPRTKLYEDFQVNNGLIERPVAESPFPPEARAVAYRAAVGKQRRSGGWWEEGQELGAREGRKEMCIKSLSNYENNGKKPLFFSSILTCLGAWATLQPVISRAKLVCGIPAMSLLLFWPSSWQIVAWLSLHCICALCVRHEASRPVSRRLCLTLCLLSASPSVLRLVLPDLQSFCLPFLTKKFLLQVHLKQCFLLLAPLFQSLSPIFSFTFLQIVCGQSHLT